MMASCPVCELPPPEERGTVLPLPRVGNKAAYLPLISMPGHRSSSLRTVLGALHVEWGLERAVRSWTRFAFPGLRHKDAGTLCACWAPAPPEGAFPEARTPRTSPKPSPGGPNFIPLAICHEHKNNLGEAHRLKSFSSRGPQRKLHSSEAPPVILMKGHQELVSFTPCPRSLYDG